MELKEKKFKGAKISGIPMIFLLLAAMGLGIYLMTLEEGWSILSGTLVFIISLLCFPGLMTIEPNDARVMLFFGKYKGTIRDNGFFWVNPFYSKSKLTLKASNLDVAPIKVNDKAGNPIMIGLVLVWRVQDTYRAMFDIDNKGSISQTARMNSYKNFVQVQSDAALRNIAGQYAYDNNEIHDTVTLRSGGEEINNRLEEELNSRLEIAGIEIVEARINYLAYAPEIAAVMLRRQQAAAIVSAREKIVEGAVGMVQIALEKLKTDGIIDLDEERKAAMVSNLLVVLCSDEQAQPVLNTGTLYQ